jgi:hypothetical protein
MAQPLLLKPRFLNTRPARLSYCGTGTYPLSAIKEAIAHARRSGTDDGKAGVVVEFDLTTLKVLKQIKARPTRTVSSLIQPAAIFS